MVCHDDRASVAKLEQSRAPLLSGAVCGAGKQARRGCEQLGRSRAGTASPLPPGMRPGGPWLCGFNHCKPGFPIPHPSWGPVLNEVWGEPQEVFWGNTGLMPWSLQKRPGAD